MYISDFDVHDEISFFSSNCALSAFSKSLVGRNLRDGCLNLDTADKALLNLLFCGFSFPKPVSTSFSFTSAN